MVYFIAFLAPFFYGLSVFIESFLSLAVFKRPLVMLFFVSLTNALFVPLVLFFGWPSVPSFQSLLFYVVIACIDITYLYPYYVALKKTDTSIVSALFSLGKIFVPILSFILLKDILTVTQYIGFFIIIGGSVILNKKRSQKLHINKAFYLMFVSSFLLALRICVVKFVLQIDGNFVNVLIYPNLISGLIPFLFLLSVPNRKEIKKKVRIYKQQFKLFVLIEFLTFWAVLSSTAALSRLSPVISTAIEATEPLFVLLIITIFNFYGFVRVKEKEKIWKKIVCFISIIIGVVLTCFSD